MRKIILRHYVVEGVDDPSWKATAETLETLVPQMSRRLAPFDLTLALQEATIHEATPRNVEFGNMVTLACPEAGKSETPIETILDLEVAFDPVDGIEGTKKQLCRTLLLENNRFQALPPGLIADAILRFSFDILREDTGEDCASCEGG